MKKKYIILSAFAIVSAIFLLKSKKKEKPDEIKEFKPTDDVLQPVGGGFGGAIMPTPSVPTTKPLPVVSSTQNTTTGTSTSTNIQGDIVKPMPVISTTIKPIPLSYSKIIPTQNLEPEKTSIKLANGVSEFF